MTSGYFPGLSIADIIATVESVDFVKNAEKSIRAREEGMVTHMQDNKAPAKTLAKPPAEKKSKWTKDDTELSILALPTTIWNKLF